MWADCLSDQEGNATSSFPSTRESRSKRRDWQPSQIFLRSYSEQWTAAGSSEDFVGVVTPCSVPGVWTSWNRKDCYLGRSYQTGQKVFLMVFSLSFLFSQINVRCWWCKICASCHHDSGSLQVCISVGERLTSWWKHRIVESAVLIAHYYWWLQRLLLAVVLFSGAIKNSYTTSVSTNVWSKRY